MAPRHGSTELQVKNSGVSPVVVDQQLQGAAPWTGGTEITVVKKSESCKYLLAVLLALVIAVVLAGGAALVWYFLDYRVWVLEPRVQQQYTAYFSILNRELTNDLTSDTSPEFRSQARHVQDLVEKIITDSSLSRYLNSTAVFAFGEGSLVVHFRVLLSVPASRVEAVSLGQVGDILQEGLTRYQLCQEEGQGFLLQPASLSVTDCYHYQRVETGSLPVALGGPDARHSSCLWHLQAAPGSQLEVSVEWPLPSCGDQLLLYDALTPSPSQLITSVYGCNRLEPAVRVLSSGQWMALVWQYSSPCSVSLSAQAWEKQECNGSIGLEAVSGVQGTLRTPFYPSYYPPDTNCTWTFTMPSLAYGLSLEFEGYELTRAGFQQPCTQGQWLVENRRLCGTRGLHPYRERLFVLSTSTTVRMTSDVALTGPGLQLRYSLFNLSEPCPGQFLCTVNGLCVSACDGIKDCPNGLDEESCVCVAQYQCLVDRRCVDYHKVCDQYPDCPNATDEENCTESVQCTDMTYACADGTCLRKTNPECDLITDCPDGSDETPCDCGISQITSRIVGGVNSSEGEWPWQASLQDRGQHICGGALVSDQWVVTAAHCFYDDRLLNPSVWTVHLGKLLLNRTGPYDEVVPVLSIHLHRYYDEASHDYDLALLRVKRSSPALLARRVLPVCLPPPSHRFSPSTLCWVTGWGALKENGEGSNVLQMVVVRLVSEVSCARTYGNLVTPRMLCAGYRQGGRDACQGDSGGPLVCRGPLGRWFLAGVVSWGTGCGRPDYYGVYSRITKVSAWIRDIIQAP
ncbi:transmembrane protease serine 6 [Gadus macrocephalus]|uniref:transmembrane protease serine 6 n=1 Tax=Gadus macrocephalus TaxID=80720 RepID=UPI0028CB5575|nr:transmembrane protease serine 6 [Gadus macrocephalus]